MAFRRQRAAPAEQAVEKPSYVFEGSKESLAFFPILFGLIAFIGDLKGPMALLPLPFVLYLGVSAVTSLIGSTAWHRNGLNERIIALCPSGRGRKMLNAVCGTGSLAVAFGKAIGSGEVWATDQWKATKRVPDPAQRTRDNIRIEGVDGIVRVQHADPLTLPFKAGYLNAVGSRYGIQNTRKDKRKAVIEMLRVLRPGGSLVLAEGLLTALWLRHRILSPMERNYKVSAVGISRFHFTFIVHATRLG